MNSDQWADSSTRVAGWDADAYDHFDRLEDLLPGLASAKPIRGSGSAYDEALDEDF